MPSDELTRRSPAKRHAILDAAIAVFLEQGYARASVDSIAAKAGVGKQTVYSHFGNKEKLFLAVINEVGKDHPAAAEDNIESTGDPRADLAAFAARILDVVLSPQLAALHRLTIAELPHHPILQRMWRDRTDRPGLDKAIVAYLKVADARGVLSVDNPELAARQLAMLAVTEGRVATLHGHEPLAPADRDRIADEVADLIVRAHRPS